MTTNIEKQFFDAFGIEPEIFTGCKLEKNNWKEDTCPFEKDGIMELCHKVCKYAFTEREIYPQITDRILLELICILVKFQRDRGSYLEIISTTKDNIKAEILDMLIHREFALTQQVQALFEDER